MKTTLDLNNTLFTEFVEKYLKLIESERYDELYKWRAVQVFQENWNLEVKDLSKMILASFTPNTNLWSGQNYLPIKMIRAFSEINPEKVRNLFRNLFDESKNLTSRFSDFESGCDEL